jgi:hypothetical protein
VGPFDNLRVNGGEVVWAELVEATCIAPFGKLRVNGDGVVRAELVEASRTGPFDKLRENGDGVVQAEPSFPLTVKLHSPFRLSLSKPFTPSTR